MLVEIICSSVLGLSVDLSKCSSTQLEKLSTLSRDQTSIVTEPVEEIQLAKGKPNESRYRREAEREVQRQQIENIRDRGYENRRRIEEQYEDYRYDRRTRESIRERIEDLDDRIEDLEREKRRLEDLDDRIEDLEREKKRLEDLERRYIRRYF